MDVSAQSAKSTVQTLPVETKPSPTVAKLPDGDDPLSLGNGLMLVRRQFEKASPATRTRVNLSWPEIKGSSDRKIARFNRRVESLVMKEAEDWIKPSREDLSIIRKWTNKSGSDAWPYINITYAVLLARSDFVCLVFEQDQYWSGAAHPHQSSFTINFDLKKGRPIKLEELFSSGTPWLDAIHLYCFDDLTKQLGEYADSLKQDIWALKPVKEHFTNWAISKEGMRVDFDRCAHFPCVTGKMTVLIPRQVFESYLTAEMRAVLSSD